MGNQVVYSEGLTNKSVKVQNYSLVSWLHGAHDKNTELVPYRTYQLPSNQTSKVNPLISARYDPYASLLKENADLCKLPVVSQKIET